MEPFCLDRIILEEFLTDLFYPVLTLFNCLLYIDRGKLFPFFHDDTVNDDQVNVRRSAVKDYTGQQVISRTDERIDRIESDQVCLFSYFNGSDFIAFADSLST